jgi:hypothetical protein
MKNIMEINGVKAVIAFDPEINMFRGEFVGLNGGADFYSTDIDGLRREGETSLKVFLDMCAEEGVSPLPENIRQIKPSPFPRVVRQGGNLGQGVGKECERLDCGCYPSYR